MGGWTHVYAWLSHWSVRLNLHNIVKRLCVHACEVTSVMFDSTTPGTVAHHAPLSMGFSRQEYWNSLPFLPLGDLPDPEIEPMSLSSPALAGGFFTTSAIWEAH